MDKDAKNSDDNTSIIKSEFTFSSLIKLNEDKKFIDNLKDLNAKANNYGLVVTEKAAREISAYRRNSLTENERVEIKSDAVTRLTSAFLESRYINQEDFAETIGELIDMFYYIQGEIPHVLSDDDLIAEMFEVFIETCNGVIEVMQSKGLEKILRKYKMNDTRIWDDYENEEWGSGEYNEYDESWRE
ncbi:MAG: DUF6323 family protein [Oscillospiraceae bacterium]|nr:DUF6323 family protein [Oscillospiraceae bacterium]